MLYITRELPLMLDTKKDVYINFLVKVLMQEGIRDVQLLKFPT
jgi:hypothetical protein